MASEDQELQPRADSSLRIGIVGTGSVARGNYIPFLAGQPDVSLGYLTRTHAKAEEVQQEHGGHLFRSPEELMDWNPDAVFVLTREMDRYAAATAILDYGPPRMFFEKPLVARRGQADVCEDDFWDARRLLKRAHSMGCATAMVFNYRFFDQTLLAKQLVADRGFGAVTSVMGLVHYACWSHCIDLVHYFAGPVAEVSALRSQETRDGANIEAVDIAACFRTEADACGTVIGTSALNWDFPLYELTFSFERGRIHLRGLDAGMEVLDARRGMQETYAAPRDRSRWDQYDDSFRKSIGAYLDSIRHGQPPPIPGTAGLQELQVEAGIRRSIAEGRPVVLPDEFAID